MVTASGSAFMLNIYGICQNNVPKPSLLVQRAGQGALGRHSDAESAAPA